MGAACSLNSAAVGVATPAAGSATAARVPKWRQTLSSEDARKKYENDGTLPRDCASGLLELRGFLDDPLLMKHVGMFGKNRKSFDCFMCWVDIQEFKSIGMDAEVYRKSKAVHIFHKYIKQGALLRVACADDEFAASIESLIDTAKKDKMDLATGIFDEFQQRCLNAIYTDIFLPFKYSTIYNKVTKSMQHHYNKISTDDFDYIEVLGQGGFGLVVHCKKKSTGKHYALKMQTKMGLLKCYKNVLHRVDFEKQALAACNHPFIVTLDYAFQTNTLVFLAMQLGTGGTLHDALSICPKKQMNEDRVRFYTAEIVLALAHIHGLGMIYRDLKPPNILLNADGHVQLVDLGGIIDPGGRVLGLHDESEYMLNGLFSKDYAHFTEDYHSDASKSGTGRSTKAKQTDVIAEVAAQGLVTEEADMERPGELDDLEDENGSASPSSPTGDGASMGVEGDGMENKPSVTRRAKSIMGTDGYMAVEMMMLKLQRHAERKGYTNAVDWWSLGVTMFVLLTGCKPFPTLNSSTVGALAARLEEPVFKNGTKALLQNMTSKEDLPQQYLYVYQKLMRCQCSPSTVTIILELLDCNEHTRLGSKKAGGITTLKEHPFFKWSFVPSEIGSNGNTSQHAGQVMMQPQSKSVSEVALDEDDEDFDLFEHVKQPASTANSVKEDGTVPPEPVAEYCWDLFEQKNIVPPFMPEAHELNEHIAYNSFDDMMVAIDKVSWLKQYPSTYYDEYFQNWNFISPLVLKMEYGIATVMEQYDSKFKARQLLGPISEETFNVPKDPKHSHPPPVKTLSGGARK